MTGKRHLGEADACNGGGWHLRRAFEFTRNRAHSVSSAEVTEALRAVGAPAISKQKLRARIEELGAVLSTNVEHNGRKLRGWVGVRLTTEVDALVNGHKLTDALCEAMECASVATCSREGGILPPLTPLYGGVVGEFLCSGVIGQLLRGVVSGLMQSGLGGVCVMR